MANLKVLTPKTLAEYLVCQLNLENILSKKFPRCSFCTIDADSKKDFNQEELESLSEDGHGWYGIKDVDTGFDSYNLVLITDYYGGGCAQIAQLYDDISAEDAAKDVCRIIVDCLNVQEVNVTEDTTLMVEFE